MKKLVTVICSQAFMVIFIANNALAGCGDPNDPNAAQDCLAKGSPKEFMDLLNVGLNILSGFVFLGAVIMLIVAGIRYITSNGNPKTVESAKGIISNVLIGLAAYIFLYAFLQWLIPGGL